MTAACILADALDRPVPADIRAFAAALLAGRKGVAAIIAYGSCLRGVETADSLIDLYLLTDDLTGVSGNVLSRLACRLVPPNVYYAEREIAGRGLRAKYAVLTIGQFGRGMAARNPYFWARFSQPAALVYAANEASRKAVIAATEQASRTMLGAARGLSSASDPVALWTAGFEATYRTELRPESASRAGSIVSANADYYAALTRALPDVPPQPANWRARTIAGKLWSLARLGKAAFTFAGAADYIAFKIERHSGQRFTPSPWQRRHPLLAGLLLLPRLLKRGAIR